MKHKEFNALRTLARLYGVMTSYIDVEGRRREASSETLAAVLRALDPRLDHPRHAGAVAREKRLEPWRRAIEPVTVAWNGRLARLPIRFPTAGAGRVACHIELESGEALKRAVRLDRLPDLDRRRIDGMTWVRRELPLNLKLPFGYHTLTVETSAGRFESLVLAAPDRAYSPPKPTRIRGVFVPLYALHSEEDWGGGHFGTMERLIEWLASRGLRVAAALPLLPAFLNEPFEPSPYSPVSRLFWNEFYIDVSRAPEFATDRAAQALARGAAFQREVNALRRKDTVDYRREMALKRRVIEKLANGFFRRQEPKRRAAFQRYLGEHPLAEDYAAFRAATEQRKEGWQQWPERMRDGSLRPGDYSESARRYYLYAQWLAHEQIAHLAGRTRELGSRFYLDLPLGVNGSGYDVWRRSEFFGLNASGGAPPDSFFTRGQDWGFAPLHPHRLRENGYAYMIDYLRHHFRQTQMLRIDHFMSLHRLYWVPRGMPATQGAYVRYHSEEQYALLCIESHRNSTVVVGENLGTVPPEVNREMDRRGIRRMFVVQYEQRSDPKRALRPVPGNSVASLNTHDMPPFNAWWEGTDIDDRLDLGLIRKSELAAKRAGRKRLNRALEAFLRHKGFLSRGTNDARSVLGACLAFLNASPAEVALVTLEDLWLENAPQNVPGTGTERVNWRRKTRHTLEEICAMPEVLEMLSLNRPETK